MTDTTLRNTYIVVEVQVNNGVAAAVPAVVCNTMTDALGQMYVALGYAYQNPRDFTFVSILDCTGNVIENRVFDNRAEKTDIYALVEIQGENDQVSVTPVTLYDSNTALKDGMYAFHNAMAFAWQYGREYTCTTLLDKTGYKSKVDIERL